MLNSNLADLPAERAVLGGLFQYGQEAYLDVADFVKVGTFSDVTNQAIYRSLKHLFEQKGFDHVEEADLTAALHETGMEHVLSKSEDVRYIRSIVNARVGLSNIRRWAAKLRKLEISRLLTEQLEMAKTNIYELSGDEPIEHILGLAENAIFDFTTLISNEDDGEPSLMTDGLNEYLDYIESNPVDNVGISSGFPHYDFAIGGGFRRGCVSLIGARPKALRYGSLVYTSDGPFAIEHVKVGDVIMHPFAKTTKVLGVHDHYSDIYRVTFRDGDTVECCGDHLWEVYKRYPYGLLCDKKPHNKTTTELMDDLCIRPKREFKWDVRLPEPVEFTEQQVELDPYILGLLIGDGSFGNSICLHTADNEIYQSLVDTLDYEIKLDQDRGKCKSYRINGLQPVIRSLGLFKKHAGRKFIPKSYIYNSIDVRLSMLQGLLDTDGDCTVDTRNKRSRSRFSTISQQLALDVKEIVQSLGGLCSVTVQWGTYKDQPHKSYRCEIRLPQQFIPFRLSRKRNKHNERKCGELKRTIADITKLNVKDNARCLTVDNHDGLFMTSNYAVTHNTGKSMLSITMALHVAKVLNIPVLYLDTEMVKKDHYSRLVPMLCKQQNVNVTINELETGKYARDNLKRTQVHQKVDALGDEVPFYYKNITGKPFEDILGIMRRWVHKTVGTDEDGNVNDCLIIYDYMKLMSADSINEGLREYQIMGFMMTTLHNFSVRHDVPILSFIQLNREGVGGESTAVISQSDRILWLVTNFAIFKMKTDEEEAEMGPRQGNRKMIPVVARHGEGLVQGDYINMNMEGKYAHIVEKDLRSEVMNGQGTNNITEESVPGEALNNETNDKSL